MTSIIAEEIVIGSYFTMIRFLLMFYLLNFNIIKRELSKRNWEEDAHYVRIFNLTLCSIYIIGDIVFVFLLYSRSLVFFPLIMFSIFVFGFIFYFFVFFIVFGVIIFGINIIVGYNLTKKYYEISSNELIKYVCKILCWQIVIILILSLILHIINFFEVVIILRVKYFISFTYPEIYSPFQRNLFILTIFILNTVIILMLFYKIREKFEEEND